MKDRRLFTYLGHVIWTNEFGHYGFAKGDGTDDWYETIEEAMKAIEEMEA